LKCLDELIEPTHEPPDVDVKVIDGAAFVNINAPKTSKTLGEYCHEELIKKIDFMKREVQRIDFVFDTYKPDSIKSQTRDNRGKGTRVAIRKSTPIPRKFQDFMRNDDNKTELFKMLAQSITSINDPTTTIIATSLTQAVTNQCNIDNTDLEPCNHEEADTCLLLHVLDASLKGFNKISIVTVDTDVVVIALFHFFDMNIAELWIEIGVGQYRRWLPIHTYARCLKEEICRALPFWFALTGCDTVSMFAGRGKKTAWSV